jgi:hypothetical protein
VTPDAERPMPNAWRDAPGAHTLGLNRSDGEARERRYRTTLAGLIGIGPQDELEGMMAAQLLATHNASYLVFAALH